MLLILKIKFWHRLWEFLENFYTSKTSISELWSNEITMIQWPTSQKSTVYWERFPENQTCWTQWGVCVVFIYSTHEESQKENSTSWPTLKPAWSNHPFGWILIIITVYLWHPSGMSQGIYKAYRCTHSSHLQTHTCKHTHSHTHM